MVHPDLEDRQRLGTVEEPPPRAPILDHEGRELVSVQPVVEVGVVPEVVDDQEAVVAEIADFTGADAEAFQAAVDAADPRASSAITPAAVGSAPSPAAARSRGPSSEARAAAGPNPDFARVLLGTVGPVTEEQIDESDGALDLDDEVGQGGPGPRSRSSWPAPLRAPS